MNFSTILVAENEGVRTITLNRSERRNAMTPEMQLELISAMQDSAERSCRVVIFKGAGDAFCSGLDLAALQNLNSKSAADHRADAERIARLFRTLYELPLATIAAVHGAAMAEARASLPSATSPWLCQRRSSVTQKRESALCPRWYLHFLLCRLATNRRATCC